MQPYFFPYIGYFMLINAVDRFILGDNVQYIKEGWINRNRILKPGTEGYDYIKVPLVKHSSQEVIAKIQAVDGVVWKEKILRQIEHYKKRAPYYFHVKELLTDCFSFDERNITKLNAHFLTAVCNYIGSAFAIEISTEIDFDYSNVKNRGDRPIQMCQQLGGSEFINSIGGQELYDKQEFLKNNIILSYLKPNIKDYDQLRTRFEPGLSIIDVMMFNSSGDIKEMLNDYEIL